MERGDELLELFSTTEKNQDTLKLPVIKLQQKNVTLYTGKLKVKNLINLYGVYNFEEENLQGYQRELYDDQVSELYQYLLNFPLAIMPGIFISVRDGVNFLKQNYKDSENLFEDLGTLEIPLRKGAFWIIDGQHRLSSFEKILANIGNFQIDASLYKDSLFAFLDYEFPVTFVDSKEAIDYLNLEQELQLTPADIERAVFFIINKTQRRLSPSLKDTLQYCIKTSGLNGIPSIEKEAWRTEAAAIGITLNSMENSPFYKKINISGLRGLNRPIQLNSFVTSLKPLFNSKKFNSNDHETKTKILFMYWSEIKKLNYKSFREDEYRSYLLLKAIGVYTLNLLLVNYLDNINSLDILNEDEIRTFVNKMKGFDWTKSNSPIAHFGGMSGVRESYRILVDYMKIGVQSDNN